MTDIEKIKAPVKEEMKHFDAYFKTVLKSKVPLLDLIMKYILKRKGKQIRPLFVFLTAKMLGNITESTYTAASLIELLHTATLVHDDVVDESYERRGFFSINALWRSKVAVLAGDYLLSKGLLIALEKKEFEILGTVSNAVREISEGELYQIQKSRKLNITEDEYYTIIRQKTATLIAACTATGGQSAGASVKEVEKLKLFGEQVGMAFQIRDDLFDYQKNGLVGKPMGNDIKEKKLTLPLIYSLKNVSLNQRKKILRKINQNQKHPEFVREVVQFVREGRGIEYATKKMNEFRDRALKILKTFPDSEGKTSITGLVDYSINRKK